LHQEGSAVVFRTIALNIANTGSFSWVVRVDIPAGRYYVLISTGAVSPSVFGAGPVSGAFELRAGCLSLLRSLFLV
jgi:hypothetical protein